MELFDLRKSTLSPKEYENIINPMIAITVLQDEYIITQDKLYSSNSIEGFSVERKPPLHTTPPLSLYYRSVLGRISDLLNSGHLIMTAQEKRDFQTYPFFIANEGDLFCVNDTLYDSIFTDNVIRYFKNTVLGTSAPLPTHSDITPKTLTYGPGYWKTKDNDYHGLKNLGVLAVNRATSMGDEGRIFLSDGRDLANTSREKVQVWSPLPHNITFDNKRIIEARSVIRRYGEERKIYQKYRESDDAWTVSGSSWQWIPGVSDEDYEFKK